jgi:replicative DNA helicase Mcm
MGMEMKIPDMRALTDFLETYCKEEIIYLANEYPEKNCIYIKFKYVRNYSSGLAEALECHFEKMSIILFTALADVDPIKFNDSIDVNKIRIRINGMPNYLKQSLRDLGKKDIEKLIFVDGFVRAITDKEPKEVKTAFECLRCGHITYVEQAGTKVNEPFAGCEDTTCGKKGPFRVDKSRCEYIDFQTIKIQESPDSTRGTKTRDIIVECDEELTNKVEPGDRVAVTGILTLKPQHGKDGIKTVHEKIIKALSIEKLDLGFEEYDLTPLDEEAILALSQDPEIIDKITKSIAPSIYGYEDIKKAIALQLFSGVRKDLPDGTVLRGNIHIALIGDPGIAKSQLLRKAVHISPRGVFTSGKTSSAAGLTAAVVKDSLNDGWTLEGGAAVMASGGILAVDEIGQIREEDKSALHEVMEQGTVSIAKAGIVSKLQADCGLLAAGNPKTGYFDRYTPFSEQIGLSPTLWSRFDLIFTMLDEPDPKTDREISDHILLNHQIGGMIQNRLYSKCPAHTEEEVSQAKIEIEAPISEELLIKYIAYTRTKVYPVTPPEVEECIQSFYLDVRRIKSADPRSPVPITARSLEAIQRLSEARARMRLSDTVSIEDVESVKKVLIASLKDVGMDAETGKLDAGIVNCGISQSQAERTK